MAEGARQEYGQQKCSGNALYEPQDLAGRPNSHERDRILTFASYMADNFA